MAEADRMVAAQTAKLQAAEELMRAVAEESERVSVGGRGDTGGDGWL